MPSKATTPPKKKNMQGGFGGCYGLSEDLPTLLLSKRRRHPPNDRARDGVILTLASQRRKVASLVSGGHVFFIIFNAV